MRRRLRFSDARRARVGWGFVRAFAGVGRSPPAEVPRERAGRLPAVEPLEGRVLMAAADLDPAFGAGGKVLTSFPGSRDDQPAAVAVSGGKIVVAGSSSLRGGTSDFALARYNSDGTLDTGFGAGGAEGSGLVITDFLGRNDIASAVSVLGSGKILVAGTSGGDITLARYNSNGTLDTSFGVGGAEGSGKVITGLGATEEAAALAVLPDGKFLVAGSRSGDFLLVRYNASGTLDTSFGGGDGWVTANFGGAEVGKAIALLSGGKVAVGGNADRDFGIARFTASGSPDTTFGGGTGRVRTSITTQPGDEFHRANLGALLHVGGDQVLAVGLTYFLRDDAGSIVYSLVRYNSNGTVNKQVNTVPALFASQPFVVGAVRLSSGKVVFGASHADQSEFVRYNSDLTPDATFGGGDGRMDVERALDGLALGSGDKIVAAGEVVRSILSRASTPQFDFRVARYNADGTLDTTFARGGSDGDGVVSTNFADSAATASRASAYGVALGPDGKVVVAGAVNGGPALLRYNPDGTPDTTFGTNGAVTDPEFTGKFHFRVVVQPDSKILVTEFNRIWRYNANGTLDASFGVGGSEGDGSITPADYIIHDLALQPDGKIVIAATRLLGIGISNYDFLVTRLNVDGTVDNTFGTAGSGRTVVDIEGNDDFSNSVALAPDGKIIITGFSADTGPSNNEFLSALALVRLNANGALDATFSPGGSDGDGRVRATFANGGGDVAVLPDGQILVLGAAGDFASAVVVLARYSTTGTLDPTFAPGGADGDGVLTTDFGLGQRVEAESVLVAADGKILVAGSVGPFNPRTAQDFFLARLHSDGGPDTAFNGGSAVVTTDFNSGGDQLGGAVLAGDGSVLLAGTSETPTSQPEEFTARIVLARYRGDVPAGAIRIDGTSGNDNIALTQSGSTLTISRNGSISTRSLSGVNRLFVYGLDGDDTLSVASSVLTGATLLGGRGNDGLRGGGGADHLFGGDGTDAADYANATAGLSISLDELGNDGPGGQDNVHGDVEILLGGAGADTLTGGTSYNVLVGHGGDDTLRGGGGRDVLIGGHGRDRLLGDDSDDLLIDSRTTYDESLPFLRTMSLEWRNTTRSYSDRVARLRAGVLGVRIDPINVPNDNVVDTITGGNGRDWFVFHSGDVRADRAADETATQL